MNSFKIFVAALMLVFALSLTSSQAADKTNAKKMSGKACSTEMSKACKAECKASGKACSSEKSTANKSAECNMHKDASVKDVKAECSSSMKKASGSCSSKKASGSCSSSCTGKSTKLDTKSSTENNSSVNEKVVVPTPISK